MFRGPVQMSELFHGEVWGPARTLGTFGVSLQSHPLWVLVIVGHPLGLGFGEMRKEADGL